MPGWRSLTAAQRRLPVGRAVETGSSSTSALGPQPADPVDGDCRVPNGAVTSRNGVADLTIGYRAVKPLHVVT